jgi:uncharacterized protein (TIGR00730 family)
LETYVNPADTGNRPSRDRIAAMSPHRLCVFCGSSMPADAEYRQSATTLGRLIGEAGMELVYGGGRVGLMGLVADAALQAGAPVIGVIPRELNSREIGHPGVTRLVVVDHMHERKRQMFALSDAIAVLPGGLGTLDETFEAVTLRQLGYNDKPIVLVDVNGFWRPLVALIDHVIEQGFVRPDARALYRVVARSEDVIPACFGEDLRP